MAANPHVMRSRMYSPDFKFANGLGPTRHPTNALALRPGRPIKKRLPAASTAQAMMQAIGRPITTPVTTGVKQPSRGKWG
jgi:hypothetical protein